MEGEKKMGIEGFEKMEKGLKKYLELGMWKMGFGEIGVFEGEFERSECLGRG